MIFCLCRLWFLFYINDTCTYRPTSFFATYIYPCPNSLASVWSFISLITFEASMFVLYVTSKCIHTSGLQSSLRLHSSFFYIAIISPFKILKFWCISSSLLLLSFSNFYFGFIRRWRGAILLCVEYLMLNSVLLYNFCIRPFFSFCFVS